jgi:hypothetical protein
MVNNLKNHINLYNIFKILSFMDWNKRKSSFLVMVKNTEDVEIYEMVKSNLNDISTEEGLFLTLDNAREKYQEKVIGSVDNSMFRFNSRSKF